MSAAIGPREDIHEILKHIPHRYPFLLIDRVEACVPNDWVHVTKNVSRTDWFFAGRPTAAAVMPQLLVVEAAAQAAGVLCHYSGMMSRIGRSLIFFAGLENGRFGRDVHPGLRLDIRCRLKRSLRGVAKLSAVASVGEDMVFESDLTAVIREVNTQAPAAP
jgi:3-hydroxyacyl-[acyl-carrier-protein] dehydratase